MFFGTERDWLRIVNEATGLGLWVSFITRTHYTVHTVLAITLLTQTRRSATV